MENMPALKKISEHFYREIDGLPDFREQVLKSLPQICKTRNEKLEFLIHNVNNYPAAYVSWLLMNVPEIFTSFSLADWNTVMGKIQRLKKPKPQDTNDRTFWDISFLCMYLKIDGLKLFAEHTTIPKPTKKIVLEFLRQHYYPWFEAIDEDYINEEGANTLHLLENYSNDFLKNYSNVQPFEVSFESISEYCADLLANLESPKPISNPITPFVKDINTPFNVRQYPQEFNEQNDSNIHLPINKVLRLDIMDALVRGQILPIELSQKPAPIAIDSAFSYGNNRRNPPFKNFKQLKLQFISEKPYNRNKVLINGENIEIFINHYAFRAFLIFLYQGIHIHNDTSCLITENDKDRTGNVYFWLQDQPHHPFIL